MVESKFDTDCFSLQIFNPEKKRWINCGETFWTKQQAEWCRDYMQDFVVREIRIVHMKPA